MKGEKYEIGPNNFFILVQAKCNTAEARIRDLTSVNFHPATGVHLLVQVITLLYICKTWIERMALVLDVSHFLVGGDGGPAEEEKEHRLPVFQ